MWRCWPTPARTPTTPSRNGGPTSAPHERTTRWNSTASTSRCPGGPFLWTRHADTRLDKSDSTRSAAASHEGYSRLEPGRLHHRTVELTEQGPLVIEDEISGGESRVRLSFHLGPEVEGRLNGKVAELTWTGGSAVMTLPEQLDWSSTRGGVDPIDGWYSPRFGERVPTTSFAGIGNLPARVRMRTEMDFTPTALAVAAAGGTGEAGAL